jgi:hypothetical protein
MKFRLFALVSVLAVAAFVVAGWTWDGPLAASWVSVQFGW